MQEWKPPDRMGKRTRHLDGDLGFSMQRLYLKPEAVVTAGKNRERKSVLSINNLGLGGGQKSMKETINTEEQRREHGVE